MPPTETGPKCTQVVKLQDWNPEVHAHLFLYDFGVMTLERTGLNGRKVSDWLRPSWALWWESFQLAETLLHNKRVVFDFLAPILDLSMVTQLMALLSLEVQRETNSCSSQEREAILLLHDTLPQVVKVSTLYY